MPQPVTEAHLPATPQQASGQEGVNLGLLWAKLELEDVFSSFELALRGHDLEGKGFRFKEGFFSGFTNRNCRKLLISPLMS